MANMAIGKDGMEVLEEDAYKLTQRENIKKIIL